MDSNQTHYKMYKRGKKWVAAGLTVTTLTFYGQLQSEAASSDTGSSTTVNTNVNPAMVSEQRVGSVTNQFTDEQTGIDPATSRGAVDAMTDNDPTNQDNATSNSELASIAFPKTASNSLSTRAAVSDSEGNPEEPEKPTEPEKPVEPDTDKPEEPDTEKPTEPDTDKPTEPDTEEPTEPDTEEPTEPDTDKPEEPGTEESGQSTDAEKPTDPENPVDPDEETNGDGVDNQSTDETPIPAPAPEPVTQLSQPNENTAQKSPVPAPAPNVITKLATSTKRQHHGSQNQGMVLSSATDPETTTVHAQTVGGYGTSSEQSTVAPTDALPATGEHQDHFFHKVGLLLLSLTAGLFNFYKKH